MPGSGAADVATELTLRIDRIKAGFENTGFFMSLDQSQCFDRIGLVNLLKILDKLDLQICFQVIANYSTLVRHIYTDGQPSDIFIGGRGNEIAGIPQGCPWSMMFLSLILRPWLLQQRQFGLHPRILADDMLITAEGDNHLATFVHGFDATFVYLSDIGAKAAPSKSYTFLQTPRRETGYVITSGNRCTPQSLP